MKKLLILLLILSGIYTTSSAQSRNAFEAGFSVGLNSSNVQYSQTNENSAYTSGVNVGGYLEYYFSDRWSIKGKLNYDQKGFGNGFLILNDGTEIDGVNYHLNYITIPVMANWHFGRQRNWYLHFGPYVGILTSANESSNTVDVKDSFNATDVGIDLGIGVKLPITNRIKIFLEYDGQSGATGIFKDSPGVTVLNIRSSFNVGLTFSVN
ncbi:MAG: porin family protein [Mucilaginibacter sp.]